MAQNHAFLETQLKDLLFTEANILMSVNNREHIFELKDAENNSQGYISAHNLKTYTLSHEEELDGMSVRNIDSADWISVYEHPLFQRRKPQVVATGPRLEKDQSFYILKQGQKTGPYQKGEIITMLDENEILLTDMVSYNDGYSWTKLFQVEDFDRRVLKESDALPGIPKEAIAQATDYVVGISEATEAISSLAYLSNVKRGKTTEREATQSFEIEKATKTSGVGIHKWLLLISFIGVGYFLYNLKNELASPFKEDGGQIIGEQKTEVLTPVEATSTPMPTTRNRSRGLGESRASQVNDQSRSNNGFEARQLNPVTPRAKKSFMDTAQYQEINNDKNNTDQGEDPNYFYDNSSAMELDPVRAQVSKENYDNGGVEQAAPANGPIPSQDQIFENEVGN